MKNLQKREVRSHNKVRESARIFRRKWSAFCTCRTAMVCTPHKFAFL